MLATQTDGGSQAGEEKQWIKEKIAQTLKVLQKRYVTTDTPVTSEDLEANLLCCALEAVFIHGIKSKFIRLDAGVHGRKSGSRAALPQPVFWSLLKTVTHRDVVQELDRLSFINSDVGRCRAWVRLALNDGLLECYLTSLLREGSSLGSYYQPAALLLDPEDREVLLTLLQGLSSLTFQLSYKSAVLNEWTNTPLVLAGLCPPTPADQQQLFHKRKESWDTASQSSGGSGGSDWAQETLQKEPRKEQSDGCEHGTPPASWVQSLDTSGSSQLSTSLSSDSLLQGLEPRSPERDRWSCEGQISRGLEKHSLTEDSSSSQDVMKGDEEDELIPAADDLSGDITDTCLRRPAAAAQTHPTDACSAAPSELCSVQSSKETLQATDSTAVSDTLVQTTRLKVRAAVSETSERDRRSRNMDCWAFSGASALTGIHEKTSDLKEAQGPAAVTSDLTHTHGPAAVTPAEPSSGEPVRHTILRRSTRAVSRRTSSDSLYSCSNNTSWISEEDFYKPEETGGSAGNAADDITQTNGPLPPEADGLLAPPSVVHRRHNGLQNPFRGLLKLGQLERRGAVGMWRDYYCELSPFELRLYINAEERVCSENLSLLRCEDVHLSSGAEGRFRLTAQGRRLYLRAASRGEAEDWVERILEAVSKLRPLVRDEQWEELQQETPSPSSAPPSPERSAAALSDPPQLDWTRPSDPEADAVKEAVVYEMMEERGWRCVLLSLSLEMLKGFRLQEDVKIPLFSHSIGTIRDVVPDVSLGSAAFFKVLTSRETLTLRAESGEEARAWRRLIRGALDSYLETEEDAAVEGGASPTGHTHRLVQHRLKGDGQLLSHLSRVPTERGLDAQSYKCAGCWRQVGVSLGRARLCHFSGQYYCDICHHGDTSIIPSRIVHNWDLTAREVSTQALKFLAQVENEPLLDLQLLNPDLIHHTEMMSRVQRLRRQLRFLGDYLLICRSDISRQIQPRLQQRMYLLQNCDVFSVLDLQQMADGDYEPYLQSLLQMGCRHVQHCDLCTQRGFICQICNTDDIIFPFQSDSTSRCEVCKTVFHSSCRSQSPVCPRCVRIQKYVERDLED